MQNTHLRRISSLCAARSFAYLSDMSALAVLLRRELHPHLGILQRSQSVYSDADCLSALAAQ
ncbi:lipoprotein signal peptidase [Neisseria sp.]|uniref:lipoprotein signal peptidase n=1 Tax=Neisseria sp. TaxID=192066 RepID=UPI0028A07587|nr:lipoprotein signal peptidase [Neisseria sp.]